MASGSQQTWPHSFSALGKCLHHCESVFSAVKRGPFELYPFSIASWVLLFRAATFSLVCYVPGPGILIVAEGSEVGMGEEGLGRDWRGGMGWARPGTFCGRGPVVVV